MPEAQVKILNKQVKVITRENRDNPEPKRLLKICNYGASEFKNMLHHKK